MATISNNTSKEVVGSFSPVWGCTAVVTTADASDNTFDIESPFWVIHALSVMILDSGGNIQDDDDLDITYSGGTITIADGSAALTAGDTIHVIAIGIPKA